MSWWVCETDVSGVMVVDFSSVTVDVFELWDDRRLHLLSVMLDIGGVPLLFGSELVNVTEIWFV